jgi:flagella basal body P-ring formation protein FlgA
LNIRLTIGINTYALKVARKWQAAKKRHYLALSFFFLYTCEMNFLSKIKKICRIKHRLWVAISIAFLAQVSFSQQSAPQISAKAKLVSDVRAWVSGEEGVSAENIEVQASDRRFRVPSCDTAFGVEFAFGAKTNVRVTCPGENWQAVLRIQIQRQVEAIVYTRSRAAGSILTADDMATELVDTAVAAVQVQQTDAEGRVLKRAVQKGELVRSSQLEESTTIYVSNQTLMKGSLVDLSSLSPIEKPYSETQFDQRFDPETLSNSILTRDISVDEIFSKSDFATAQEVVATTTLLERGSLFDQSTIRLELRTGKLPRDAITEPSQLARATAKRRLNPGTIIRFADISIEPHVKAGQTVTLTLRRNQFQLTLDMLAMEDGYLGDRIRLQNQESNEIVFATVTGVGLTERR